MRALILHKRELISEEAGRVLPNDCVAFLLLYARDVRNPKSRGDNEM
jgi:hypothetical protein